MSLIAQAGRITLADTDGRLALDTDDATLHQMQFISGEVVLPRVNYPQQAPLQEDYDLGPLHSEAKVFGGTWWISDNDGMTPGGTRRNSAKDRDLLFFSDYAPRIALLDAFSASGLSFIDFMRPSWNNSPAGEVGDRCHLLQFYFDNGRMKVRRGGIDIAHWVAQFQFIEPGSPVQRTGGPVYECVELTIRYRLWIGTFT